MGMFDYVKYKAPCWNCDEIIENDEFDGKPDWQTKDSECELEILDPENPDIQRFYTSCRKCGKWNEYEKQERFILTNKH